MHGGKKTYTGKLIYNEAVKEALILLWETADRICSKRLRAVIPDLIDAMERHKHLNLNKTARQRLLKISASSIDRSVWPETTPYPIAGWVMPLRTTVRLRTLTLLGIDHSGSVELEPQRIRAVTCAFMT